MENRTDAPLTVDFTVEGPGCDERGHLELEPESDDAHIVLITCPGDTEELPEINTYTVRFTAGGYTGTYCFGLAAATPWKAVPSGAPIRSAPPRSCWQSPTTGT